MAIKGLDNCVLMAGDKVIGKLSDYAVEINEKGDDDMTDEGRKHYIYDEDLKVEREYVEVSGSADVGDYVLGDGFLIRKVTEVFGVEGVTVEHLSGEHGGIYTDDYYTKLSPTNIVRIAGERYEMVARTAEVGEKVIIINAELNDTYGNGKVFDVERSRGYGVYNTSASYCGNRNGYIRREEYNVLVPITKTEGIGDYVFDSDYMNNEVGLVNSDTERLTRQMASLAASYAKLKREVAEMQAPDPEVKPTEADNVNSPAHYQNAKFETIEVIEELTQGYDDGFVSYCVGNALKYLARAPYKHGEPTEDLRKAGAYIQFAIEHLAKEGE